MPCRLLLYLQERDQDASECKQEFTIQSSLVCINYVFFVSSNLFIVELRRKNSRSNRPNKEDHTITLTHSFLPSTSTIMTTLKAVHSGMMMRGLSIRRMSLQTANRTRLLSAMPQLQDSEEPHQPPFLDENNAASLSAFRSYALHSPQFKYPHKTTSTVTTNPSTSFAGFVDSIPQTVRRRQETLRKNPAAFDDGRDDPVMALFRYVILW